MPPEAHGSAPDRSHTKDKLHKKYSFTNYAVPTGALDSKTSKDILILLEKINQQYGTTMLIVTHNNAIRDMVHKVIIIRDGQISEEYENETRVPAKLLEDL